MKVNNPQQFNAYEDFYKVFEILPDYQRKDNLTSFLRYRRLKKSLDYIDSIYTKETTRNWKVLIICCGPGSEGSFFIDNGFNNVTISDYSLNALEVSKKLNNNLKAFVLNAEAIALDDNSFDLCVVQDGLHHLTRPALGFTEMLRISKSAIIVIEPYNSLVGKFWGKEWEEVGDSINYVFRWDLNMINQVVKSYLLKDYTSIKVFRIWDHSLTILKFIKFLPEFAKLLTAKFIYKFLSIFNSLGNMMICVVIKNK
jgi:ubiquinone/menaquinone biosynthesis C-methylase UbiE